MQSRFLDRKTTMTLKDIILRQIEFTRSLTLRRIEHFPKDAHFARLPNGGNHFIWLVGHLVWSEDALILTCCGSKSLIPAEMSGFFAYGAKLLEDEDQYPELDQLLDMMGEVHKKVLEFLSGMKDSEILGDTSQETHPIFKELFPTKLDAIVHAIRHEWYHVGQVSALDRIQRLLQSGIEETD